MASDTPGDSISKILDQVDNTLLEEDDLHDLMKELIDVVDKWNLIGVALRLKQSKIRAIEEGNHGNLTKCLLYMLTDWLNKKYNTEKFGEPSWRKIVEAVASPVGGDNIVLAETIARKHQRVLHHVASSKVSDSKATSFLDSLISELKSQLQFLINMQSSEEDSDESKIILMKDMICQFIKKEIQSKADREEIRKCLTKLYTDLVLSKELYEWALRKTESLIPKVSCNSPGVPEEKKESVKPLFCEDTVYHASLCCYAVGTRDATNYNSFFSKYKHQFDELSFSCSHDHEDVNQYLIARKGKTYFIAFLSEPIFLEWPKHFKSFAHGIEVQTSRIPLRFLIQQLHDGYQIVCTGFSFGGLLALSVTASLWKQGLISTNMLEKNLCCISLSPSLTNLPVVQEVTMEMPQIKSTLHSILVKDDFIPCLTMFLDPENENVCSESVLNFGEVDFSSIKDFQGLFTSNLLHQIGILQNDYISKNKSSGDNEAIMSTAKLLLQKAWPHILSKRLKTDVILGCVYLMDINSSKGLVWTLLTNGKLMEVIFQKNEDIDSLTIHSLFKNDVQSYHEKILKCFVKNLPEMSTAVYLPEMKLVKPVVDSVSFHRYGKEFAITVTGDNLWFCSKVKVGLVAQTISAEDSSQKSLQFNRDVEDIVHVSSTSDQLSVKVWSHFSRDRLKYKAIVKHKVYQFTFRQEQLAKLTPSELIKTGYLSALLEQLPHTAASHTSSFSRRFETIRNFLMKVVSVVPIESLVHAIAVVDDVNIASQCCRQLMNLNIILPQSITMLSSLNHAIIQMEIYLHNEGKGTIPRSSKEIKEWAEKIHADKAEIVSRQQRRNASKKSSSAIEKATNLKLSHNFGYQSKEAPPSPFKTEFAYLYYLYKRYHSERLCAVICGINLNYAYPLNVEGSKSNKGPLSSPLQILKDGREKMQWLVQSSTKVLESSVQSQNPQKLTQLYNSKMLEIVNQIRTNEVEVCSVLLGAFMEEQIRVPLMKTSFDTARAIEIATSAAAVGIWALYSLTLGNVQAIIDAIPSRSLLVEVKDYMKGVFKQDTATADENYAGKLQFMVQGMKETVSCNSHYVSYSLERQLIELCKPLKIDETTPLEALISNWDEIFKDNVMSLVIPSYHSLIARWLKWALMVHHLREELARYTAVGVVGLVNSGKSSLVSTLFNVKIPVGTTAVKRTTVPFLYNMDGAVDGLDVIDFPGVDDRDETISDLAELLLAIAQVVVFVVDYRKAHTESAKKWLELLEDKSVPVLVCLTYADKLYAECMGRDGSHPNPLEIKLKIEEETHMMVEQLGNIPSRKVQFYSFSQDRDSTLNSEDGRERLQGAGIGTPQDVGDWLAEIFEQQLDQDELAEKLRALVHRAPHNKN